MFERVCAELNLGELTAQPLRLSGGYTHQMFRLDTAAGRYAVKLLNPEIMQRPDAADNYRTAEAFEEILEQRGLSILPARVIGGRKMHCVGGQYLYVFDYYEGCVLQPSEITPDHCAKMGEVLARIHLVDRREAPGDVKLPASIDWTALAEGLLAAPHARSEGELLRCAVPMLEHVTAAAEDAARRLPRIEALCHNDMDPKNVLWRGDDFRIIDLECLGNADPQQEMLDLAISWAEPCNEAKFKAFVSAYYAAGGERPTAATLLYDSRRNYIDWLAYSVRRAISPDPEERCVGREQVRATVGKIKGDLANRDMILQWMEEIQT